MGFGGYVVRSPASIDVISVEEVGEPDWDAEMQEVVDGMGPHREKRRQLRHAARKRLARERFTVVK